MIFCTAGSKPMLEEMKHSHTQRDKKIGDKSDKGIPSSLSKGTSSPVLGSFFLNSARTGSRQKCGCLSDRFEFSDSITRPIGFRWIIFFQQAFLFVELIVLNNQAFFIDTGRNFSRIIYSSKCIYYECKSN